MQKVFNFIKQKTTLLAAVVLAAIVGGASVAIVLAAVPSLEGVIHGCYRTGGFLPNGALRIIDNTTQNCNANETALNWDQSGWRSYGYIKDDFTLDTSVSKNVTAVTQLAEPLPNGYCIFTDINPSLISLTTSVNSPAAPQGVVRGRDAGSDSALDESCGTTAKALILTQHTSPSGGIYFFLR